MRTQYSDVRAGGTNWSMAAITQPSLLLELGGLVLKDIQHDGHHFAKDVRLIAFWVFVDVLDGAGRVLRAEAGLYHLRASGRMTATAVQELRPAPVSQPPFTPGDVLSGVSEALDFGAFFRKGQNQAGYGLRVDYTGTSGMFSRFANFEFDAIDLSQIFLFSHYGMTPPHEPGGVLTAARMHPMITYAFRDNPRYDTTKEHRRLTSIRFDYRFQLYLDAFFNTINAAVDNGNNAGAFRDADRLELLTAIGTVVGVADVSSVVFDGAEKPLVFEITGPGLAKGASAFPAAPVTRFMTKFPPTIACWDNLHCWGGGVGKNMISTPGAFHAAHLHWRWGGITGLAPHGSDPQFGPGGVPAALRATFLGGYGILVDPRIWIQSVRFAVVLDDPKLDPAKVPLGDLTNVDWKQTFEGLRNLPADISNPSNLVQWYSIEVHRDVMVPSVSEFTPPRHLASPGGEFTTGTSGTVFIHGIFFAHEPEQTSSTIGTRKALYTPVSESEIRRTHAWFRHP